MVSTLRSDIGQIESEILLIENETEQLRREKTRQKALSALIRQQCFPSDSSSTQARPLATEFKPSSP